MLIEKIMEILSAHSYKPMNTDELANVLGLEKNEKKELRKVIDGLMKDGLVIKIKKEKIVLPEEYGVYTGRIDVNKRGFGFVARGEGKEDIFVPENAMKTAMHGDKVQVKVMRENAGSRRAEGEVLQIIERKNNKIIGVYEESKAFGFVVPEDTKMHHDVFINKKNRNYAENGDVVVVEITKWPEKGRNPEGLITEILGKKGDKGVDILTVVKKYNLPEEFSPEVIGYTDRIPEEVPEKEIERRRDLRQEMIMTIDGADAKDLDDAVSVFRLENGNYKLSVHIADVTHFVKEGSPIDKEAFKRATSVYLLDLVIPMLPKKLSNNLCSLNPYESKLTLSCDMIIDPQGKVVEHDIYESIIESKLRATYADVTRVLNGEMDESLEKYKAFIPMIRDMEELQHILEKKRERRGAIEFDFPESKITLDKLGKPVDVSLYPREISNKMIEEFMLACNETVAEHMFWAHVPFIYRIHEEPDEEKLKAFTEFSFNLGYPVKLYAGVQPKMLQEILEKVKGEPAEPVLSKLLLRSMMQARYAPENIGHFGLAATYYSHFTSPIRRYPDLQIHRIIKEFLNGELDEKRAKKLIPIVAEASKQASEMERVAVEAERELDALKKAEFMKNHVGETFEGIISSVTNFGLFVELPNTIEGLIHITSLYDDYYVYDDRYMTLIGERSGKKFSLGEKIEVLVSNVNLDSREIFFEVSDGEDSEKKSS
ncbi:ribonuclease R [Proteiniclasticum sp. SCR006]|uniref:Ribonuclease R n=1 Tax=Proteiniclasticum aestuarii TaxID=2817862 RepID=A0A939HBM8_9CLOT|nr:ribonuclease R [Proteiniclasticum aestuarii]MBO1266179.1 ribonuclease R [Proteiniclasticum aestuarii]